MAITDDYLSYSNVTKGFWLTILVTSEAQWVSVAAILLK